jgi:hypothetical protein
MGGHCTMEEAACVNGPLKYGLKLSRVIRTGFLLESSPAFRLLNTTAAASWHLTGLRIFLCRTQRQPLLQQPLWHQNGILVRLASLTQRLTSAPGAFILVEVNLPSELQLLYPISKRRGWRGSGLKFALRR